MARSRNIKPGFFSNDVLGELPALTRLLFAGLWTIADREGRIEDRPKKIRAEALGGENSDANMQLLRKLCNLKKNAKHPVDYMQSKGFLL